MRTRDLIDALAADTHRVPADAPARWLGLATLAGAAVALALVISWLKLRPDLGLAMRGEFFWIKAAYTATLGAAGFWATQRLARPGVSVRAATVMGVAVIVGFEILAMIQFSPMGSASRLSALRGVSWQVCTRNIVILAAPLTVLSVWVLRRMAPTRPTVAGFAAGAFSGGVAATIYGLHCPEATFVFIGVWYTLGVIVSGLFGALLGRAALRW